jgi:hypothetical protein
MKVMEIGKRKKTVFPDNKIVPIQNFYKLSYLHILTTYFQAVLMKIQDVGLFVFGE